MTDQENKELNAKIIQGPWAKSKRKVRLPDTDALEVQENIAFVPQNFFHTDDTLINNITFFEKVPPLIFIISHDNYR